MSAARAGAGAGRGGAGDAGRGGTTGAARDSGRDGARDSAWDADAVRERVPAASRDRLRPAAPTADRPSVRPMLATLTDRRDFGADWIFERKLDGVRVLALRDAEHGVRLLSRTGQPLNGTYPEVVAALEAQGCGDFAVDGEVCALEHGRTDFALLQRRMGLSDPRAALATGVAVVYFAFDLTRVAGWDTTRLPLRARKALLRDTLTFGGPLRFTAHRNHDPDRDLLGEACGRGWEGLIAKRADAPYQPRRSPDWLKLKCVAEQEFVIGGFTEPAGSRTGFGALLLGYYEDDRLRYAGKVGTGYDRATLTRLRGLLDQLALPRAPFGDPVRERGAHWTRPALVAQIGFTEWTRDGMLRHPRFLGLRQDKEPGEVVRERPGASASSSAAASSAASSEGGRRG